MQTCSCGAPAEDADNRCARCAALHVLDLDWTATENAIKDAYRVLVKVWHPDRFPGDQKLKDAAEEKLKALNAAYVFLTRKDTGWRPRPRPKQAAAQTPRSTPQPIRQAGRSRSLVRVSALLVGVGVLGCGILLAVLFFKAVDSTLASDPTTGSLYSVLRGEVAEIFHETAGKIRSEAGQQLHDLIPQNNRTEAAVQSQLPDVQLTDASPKPAATVAQNLHPRELGATHPAPAKLLPYITVGLTKDEVVAILGTPTSASEDKLVYQGSEIDFTDGKVSGWKIDPVSAPIRVKLWPTGSVDPDLDSFGVGSSKNVVLVVQGTPTAFTENTFSYGGSEVYFRDDRVVSWKNDPAWPLRTAPR